MCFLVDTFNTGRLTVFACINELLNSMRYFVRRLLSDLRRKKIQPFPLYRRTEMWCFADALTGLVASVSPKALLGRSSPYGKGLSHYQRPAEHTYSKVIWETNSHRQVSHQWQTQCACPWQKYGTAHNSTPQHRKFGTPQYDSIL